MSNFNLDVRVFPIDEPKGSTLAFASVGVEDIIAIRGVRVVDSDKGPFVAMPQSQDKDGEYHDIAFPIDGDLRKELNKAVLDEYKAATRSQNRRQSMDDKLRSGKQKAAEQAPAQRPAAAKSRGSYGRD